MPHRAGFATAIMALGLLSGMGFSALSAIENQQGDLDNSGTIDAVDLVLLTNYQSGNLDSLPAQFGQIAEVDPIVGVMRRVPAGTFTQGSPGDEPCRGTDEAQFSHTLIRNLAVMETEVTRQMWADLRAAQPTLQLDPTVETFGSGPDNPVQSMNWYEGLLFANLLSAERGLTRCYYTDAAFTVPIDATNYITGPFHCNWNADGYRLPTEGEWERFCRGGTATPFWIVEPDFSADNCNSVVTTPGTWPLLETAVWFCANIYDPAGNTTSKPIANKAANPWGMFDTHGNVNEWCWDWYDSYPTGSATNYAGASSGSHRVIRGGCWSDTTRYCRSACRQPFMPGSRHHANGFRLVRTLP